MNKIDLYEQKAQQIIDNWENYTRITDANYFENDKEYEGLYIKDCVIEGIRNATFKNCMFENVKFVNFNIILIDIISLNNIETNAGGIYLEFTEEKPSSLRSDNESGCCDIWGFSISHKEAPPKNINEQQNYNVLLMPAIKRWLYVDSFQDEIKIKLDELYPSTSDYFF